MTTRNQLHLACCILLLCAATYALGRAKGYKQGANWKIGEESTYVVTFNPCREISPSLRPTYNFAAGDRAAMNSTNNCVIVLGTDLEPTSDYQLSIRFCDNSVWRTSLPTNHGWIKFND